MSKRVDITRSRSPNKGQPKVETFFNGEEVKPRLDLLQPRKMPSIRRLL